MNKIPKITMWVLAGISVVIGVLFYAFPGNETIEVGGESIWNPLYTGTLINWTYFLLGLSILITIAIVAFQFVKKLKSAPKEAIKSLLSIVVVALVFIISYLVGSGDKLDIIGYEGTDNVGFWAKFTDMCLYAIYVMMSVAFVIAIASNFVKQLKK
jgi:uncharacterized membrane protein YhaH (DUF805 family)